MSTQHYLIIGFGVFGISAALHLLDDESENQVRLSIVSHPQPQAPSEDISKIIRIDYASEKRMKEAIHVQECWKSNESFQPFYLPVGRVVAYDSRQLQTLDGIDSARSSLGLSKRQRLDGSILAKVYDETNASNDFSYVYNEDDALVEWGGCIQSMRRTITERCLERGNTTVLENRVQELVHHNGHITAVLLADGGRIETADSKIILTTGPWITGMLERSGIEQPPRARAPVATGVFTFLLQLKTEQMEFFKGKPAFSQIGYGRFFNL